LDVGESTRCAGIIASHKYGVAKAANVIAVKVPSGAVGAAGGVIVAGPEDSEEVTAPTAEERIGVSGVRAGTQPEVTVASDARTKAEGGGAVSRAEEEGVVVALAQDPEREGRSLVDASGLVILLAMFLSTSS
jgi:subtilisin family serine protease